MAYLDILSPDAYGQFNRRLAKLTSLNSAIYFQEILDISSQVVKKKKFDSEGFFKLDRKYIEDRTTLDEAAQVLADAELTNLGVLEGHAIETDKVRIKLNELTNILVDDTITPTKSLKKKIGASKEQAKESRRAGIIGGMMRFITETDEDILNEYHNWMEAVYENKYYLTKQQVITFESDLKAYTTDKKTMLELLKVAKLTGYRVFDWVKSSYEKNKKIEKANDTSKLAPAKVSTGLKQDVSF